MSNNSRILDKFTGYNLEDCACEYCLYHSARKGCSQDVCCCAEEKKQAIERAASTARKTS